MELYRRAFRHISVTQHHSESYEALEFLGDSVLGMVTAQYLFKTYPEETVGRFTKLRARAVNQESLSNAARKLGFEELIEIEHSTLRDRTGIEDSVLADCFESLVGAIFIDKGIRTARSFALKHLKPVFNEAISSADIVDYKSSLQEYLQQHYHQIPRYRRTKATGPDHARIFTVECTFKGSVLSKGRGTSLKRAEQDAARKAQKKIEKSRRKHR